MATDRSLAQKIALFFVPTIIKSVDGNSTNFSELDDPSEVNFKKLMNSSPFFDEAESRALIDSITAIKNKTGIVTIATDAEVLTYTDGLKVDRSVVPTAKNLTEVVTSSATDDILLINDVPAFSDTIVTITKDVTETKRNKFFPQIKATFITWLETNVLPRLIKIGGTAGQVLEKIDGTNYNVQWVTPTSSGEVNDGANVGGAIGEIYRDKTGLNLNFKTISSANAYLLLTNNADTVAFNIDEAALLAYMQANLTFTVFTPATTTTWITLASSNLTVTLDSGSGGTLSATSVTGSIRYMVIDKTVFLSVSLQFKISSTGARTSNDCRARIGIETATTGTVANNKSLGVFNLVYNSSNPTSFDVISSTAGTGSIHNVQPLPVPNGSGPTQEFYKIKGSIVVEIN